MPKTFSGFVFALVALLQVPVRPIAFSYTSFISSGEKCLMGHRRICSTLSGHLTRGKAEQHPLGPERHCNNRFSIHQGELEVRFLFSVNT